MKMFEIWVKTLFVYLVISLIVLLLWNYNNPEIIGWEKINYGQAISITVLVNILLTPTQFNLSQIIHENNKHNDKEE